MTESDTADQLISDTLRYELCVNFRLADFNDVQLHFSGGKLVDQLLQLFNVRTLFADNHTRTCGVD